MLQRLIRLTAAGRPRCLSMRIRRAPGSSSGIASNVSARTNQTVRSTSTLASLAMSHTRGIVSVSIRANVQTSRTNPRSNSYCAAGPA